MIRFIESFHRGFSDISIKIDLVVGEKDQVALAKTVTAIHSAEFMGKQATGRRIELHVMEIDVLKDGRITDHWSRNNFAQVLASL